MKKTRMFITLMGCLLCSCIGTWAQDYDQLWKQLQQAQEQDLPKRVIQLAGQIADKAEREQQMGQWAKATLCRNAYVEQLTPDSLYLHLKQWEQRAESETHPLHKAVMHSLAAEAFTLSRERQGWQLRQRTELEEAPTDIRLWTTEIYNACIARHLSASLQPEEALLEGHTENYLPLVVQADGSRHFAHDLYHLLAKRAISLYQRMNNEAGNPAIDSLQRRMTALYTRRKGAEGAALLVALDAWQTQPEPRDGSLLDSLMARYAQIPLCAALYQAKAEWLQREAQRTEGVEAARRNNQAILLCDEALRRYPSYDDWGSLRNLKASLLQPELRIHLSQGGYPSDTLPMSITATNLAKVTLHIYRTSLSEWPRDPRMESQPDRIRRGVRVASQVIRIEPSTEAVAHPLAFRQTVKSTLQLPAETGIYVVEAIPDHPTRSGKPEYLLLSVSRLKLLTLHLPDGQIEGVVVDSRSGYPQPDVHIRLYQEERGPQSHPLTVATTDRQGRVVVKTPQQGGWLQVESAGDTALPPIYVRGYLPRPNQPGKSHTGLTLLTDRSLYRPGQQVHVKGIAYRQTDEQAHVLKGERHTLRLLDANRQEWAKANLTTNEYGSWAHTFTLPAKGLNGMYRLEVPETGASCQIRVEEYKRPTFEIELAAPTQAYRLGDSLQMQGRVQAFNGTALQQARVIGRLTRRTSLFRYPSTDKPIFCDTVAVDPNGRFTLTVPLAKESDHPAERVFYQIEATVIDDSGETHSASRTLSAGHEAYLVRAELPEVLFKEELEGVTLAVTNQEQVPQAPAVTYQLYPRDEPEKRRMEGTLLPNQPTDCRHWSQLASGYYALRICISDSLGRREEHEMAPFLLMSRNDTRPAKGTPLFYHADNLEYDDEHPARFLLGSSLRDACLLLTEIDAQGRYHHSQYPLSDTLMQWQVPYREEEGAGKSLHVAIVNEGKLYQQTIQLQRRPTRQKLQWRWEVFRDKLKPGDTEEWRLILTDAQGLPADAELLATMYDASLDQIFRRHQSWPHLFSPSLPHSFWQHTPFSSSVLYFDFATHRWKQHPRIFDQIIGFHSQRGWMIGNRLMQKSASLALTRVQGAMLADAESAPVTEEAGIATEEEEDAASLSPEEGVRTELGESAFFYPHLQTDSLGRILFSFRVPESLTKWNFQAYAHTRTLQTAQWEEQIQTAKEWMLTAHLPRFLRAGDRTEVTATLANQTGRTVDGEVKLTLFDPYREKTLKVQRHAFRCPAGGSCTVRFMVEAGSKQDLLGVRLVASGAGFSDGEQHLLPVVSHTQWVTETLPMPLRSGEERTFRLDSLFNRQAASATHRRLSIEMTGNPAWMAVQALPSLTSPSDPANAISWATAYYAQQLAVHLAATQPGLRAVAEAWRLQAAQGDEARPSDKLKEIALEETPWVESLQKEAERMSSLADLFDTNQANQQLSYALEKLIALQQSDGRWSWYPGMRGNDYVTAYVTELLLRLPRLTGKPLPTHAAERVRRALKAIYQEAHRATEEMKQSEKQSGKRRMLLPDAAHSYLYLTALQGAEIPSDQRGTHRYLLERVARQLTHCDLMRKAESAYILWQAGQREEANRFLRSLQEYLVQEKENGTHLAETEPGQAWGHRALRLQVRALEVLQLTDTPDALIEEMKLWLLKQKQTCSWESSVASADAIYALLSYGRPLLADEGAVEIRIGSEQWNTTDAGTPGLQYSYRSFSEPHPVLKARQITIRKSDQGAAWGAVYAQYASPLSDLREQGNELRVEKHYYVERLDANGQPKLHPLSDGEALQVGEKVVARLTLRLERAMEFLHLKDGLAACLEPTGALSGYRWSNGMGYYIDRKDAAVHCYFDRLAKGVYVLEQPYHVVRSGRYQTGIATLQCHYAPEFTAHSSAREIEVK